MHMDSTTLLKSENAAKLPVGPTTPRPGPILLIQEMTAVNEVVKSKLSTDISSTAEKVIMKYEAMNLIIPEVVFSGTALPSNLITFTARGWIKFTISCLNALRAMTTRDALRPPL